MGSIVEDLLDEVEHHLKWGSLSLEIGSLEYIWSLDHEVNQWDRGLADEISDVLMILKVDVDDVLVDSPHSLADFILVVDELCDNSETLISVSMSWLRQSCVDRLLKNFFELRV